MFFPTNSDLINDYDEWYSINTKSDISFSDYNEFNTAASN